MSCRVCVEVVSSCLTFELSQRRIGQPYRIVRLVLHRQFCIHREAKRNITRHGAVGNHRARKLQRARARIVCKAELHCESSVVLNPWPNSIVEPFEGRRVGRGVKFCTDASCHAL